MAPQKRRSSSPRAAGEVQALVDDQRWADAGGEPIRTARDAAAASVDQIVALTGRQPESIVGVQREDDGWSVSFEVVEDRRIPSSADILAIYEAKIDTYGELMSLQRVSRYHRGRSDVNGESASRYSRGRGDVSGDPAK
jgi:hypothetical protein